MKSPFDSTNNYIMRVSTKPDTNGNNITIGFAVNKEAFDALKDKHNFVYQQGHFKYCSDEEFYRIEKLIKEYLEEKSK